MHTLVGLPLLIDWLGLCVHVLSVHVRFFLIMVSGVVMQDAQNDFSNKCTRVTRKQK